MKEGFLFGLGFSLVYFATHYASIAATYYLTKWYERRRQRKLMDGVKNLAAESQQKQAWEDLTN